MDIRSQQRQLATKIITEYCLKDTLLPILLLEKDNSIIEIQETGNVCGVDFMDTYTRGQGVRVASSEYMYMRDMDYMMDVSTTEHGKYKGGRVEEPMCGLHYLAYILDFASLYPSIMRRYNMCLITLVNEARGADVPDEDCYVFDFEEDGEKFYHRFVKESVLKGILPSILSDQFQMRKAVKWDMAKLEETCTVLNAIINMDDIETELPELSEQLAKWEVKRAIELLNNDILDSEDLEEFTVKARALIDQLKVEINVLDSRQKALKVAMNSIYGDKGASTSKGTCVPITRCVCHMGRDGIRRSGEAISKVFNSYVAYGDTDSVMMCCDWMNKYLIEMERKKRSSPLFIERMKKEQGEDSVWAERDFESYLVHRIEILKNKAVTDLGKKMESYLNENMFQAPMKMEFENIYLVMGNISKKMYFYVKSDMADPQVLKLKNYGAKGLPNVKRDRSPYLKKNYEHLSKIISLCFYLHTSKDFDERITATMNDLRKNHPRYHEYAEIFLGGKSLKDIVIDELGLIAGRLKNKQVELKDFEVGARLSGEWKNEKYKLALFYQYLKSSGQNIKPGDRVNYIVVKDPLLDSPAQGDNYRTVDLLIEQRKRGVDVDYDYYLKSLSKVFTDLIVTCIPEISARDIADIIQANMQAS